MRPHRIEIFHIHDSNRAMREEMTGDDNNKKHKFTTFDIPLFLLRILNWIIYHNEKGRKPLKCKILIIISVVIHTIGAILQVTFYFGLYTNEKLF